MRLRPRSAGALSVARAFTLIELLVVIGIVALVAGGIGLSLGAGGGRGAALSNAQGTLSSALAGVRAQAAINQQNAALFVNATPSNDGFLRELRIAVDTTGAGNWQIRSEVILLPSGIYVVPGTGVSFNATTELALTGTWTGLRSTAYDITNVQLRDQANTLLPGSVNYHRLITLTPRGTIFPAGTSGNLVLSPGELAGSLVTLREPDAVRGARLSQYGVAIPVQDAESFK